MARIARCEVAVPYAWAAMAFLGKLLKYRRAKPGQVLFWAGTKDELKLLGTASAGRGVGEAQLTALLLHPVSQNLALLFI